MRRTYRSKKDTGGALDHRDVIQSMDEKSSAFDAFYIQNIKQTKRELSCVGSSNAIGIASNRVRKRKYVRRIVKDVENVLLRPSMSTSTYLTPDKSIRVNKILDPFDMLLNSSSNAQVACKSPALQTFIPKKPGKTYTKKKPKAVKKFNYTSDYSLKSDKENTSKTQSNTTDIRGHELIVEKFNNSPKTFDESINKIVNNISLINSLKRRTANNSFNTSYKHKNRLTKNCQSPILQRSPLCSTPFKEKYRGKSIYIFSPISVKSRESPNYGTITEENNESSNSNVFPCKENTTKLSKDETSRVINAKSSKDSMIYDDVEPIAISETDYVNENAKDMIEKSLIYDDIEIIPDECENVNVISTVEGSKTSELTTKHSMSQTFQAAPFLGFSNIKEHETVVNEHNYLLKLIQEHNIFNESENDKSLDNKDIDNNKNGKEIISSKEKAFDSSSFDSSLNDDDRNESNRDSLRKNFDEDSNISENNISVDIPSPNSRSSIKSNAISSSNDDNVSVDNDDSDNESMYDTCNSEQSMSEDRLNDPEPKVTIQKLNDSVFIKYYEKMLANISVDRQNNPEPKVTIQKLNDSVFFQYYEKMLANQPGSSSGSGWTDEDDDESDDEVSNRDNNKDTDNISSDYDKDESSNSFHNCSQNTSVTSKPESDSVENPPNEILITDSSTTEDNNESNEEASDNEEIHVSFVTTRRRNEFTNDSMFIFDNSYGSSSTDCDKTVLSNKFRLSNEKADFEIDKSKQDSKIIEEQKDSVDKKHKRTSRKSSRFSRSSIKNTEIKSRKNDNATIIETELIEDSSDDNTNKNLCKQEVFENTMPSVTTRKSSRIFQDSLISDRLSCIDSEAKPSIVLQPGKKWERSLSIYRRMTTMADHFNSSILEEDNQKKGRKYRQSVINTMELQDSLHNASINSRRSTFISKPSRSTIRFVKDSNTSRISLNTTEVFDDLKGFLNEECDDTVIELSKLSLDDTEFEVTVLDANETSERIATARDYVLRRCNQTGPLLFDECYPETVLKNCHKIGEGVYGEVFLWRGRDGRARVMKIVPIAGTVKVNGETQKDFHEVISEIVIAMELSALRAPIAEIDRYFDEGKDIESLDLHSVENATDVFNEVLAVRCVQGPYPSRLLDLWELYDECKGSENDNPATLPRDQQFMVLELANAGQDLESYQFTGAQQAHALFQQIAFGLAVGEESFQFEHRDLHWGNVLIAPTDQKVATFVLRGRTFRVARGGVAATIIDYSLSRVTLPLAADRAALYNDLATDDQLFEAVGDYQFQVYRLMRDKLGNDWKNFEPYTNILWLHYTVDKMITALRYKRTNTKIHKHYIEKLTGIKDRILAYKSATDYVLNDIEI